MTTLEPFQQRVIPPAPGGPNDPRVAGATLVVYNANGPASPHDAVSVFLDAAKWTAIGGSSISGYKYTGTDPSGPVAKVVLKNDTLQVRGGKANWPYTLDEPAQGRVAVRLLLSDGTGWCAEAPAKVSGNPPSTANNDHQDKFVGQPKSAAPAACPALP